MKKQPRGHLYRRAGSRVEIDLDVETIRAWRDLIEGGNAKFVMYGYQSRRIYELEWRGATIRVIYNPETRYIVTILPMGSQKPRRPAKCLIRQLRADADERGEDQWTS